MNIFRRLVFTAVFAGLFAGSLISLSHYFGTASIIARAEVLEKTSVGVDNAHAHSHATANAVPHGHGAAAEWEPGTQAARGRFTDKARDTDEIYSSRRADAVAAGLVLLGAVALRSLLRAPVRAARLLR